MFFVPFVTDRGEKMASVKKKDIPEAGKFMVDFWEHIKAVWIVEDDEGYWEDVVRRTCVLLERYKDPFCRGQVLRFLDYLEEKGRR